MMRKILLTTLVCFLTQLLCAQNKVEVDSAAKHMGEKVTICTKVFGVKSLDKLTFINVGAAYPQSPLTIVIFAKDLSNFKDLPETLYNNKHVCITGKIEDY
ncbi:MAG: hypothetical protein WCG67_06620 [Ferruginibacter sp.]